MVRAFAHRVPAPRPRRYERLAHMIYPHLMNRRELAAWAELSLAGLQLSFAGTEAGFGGQMDEPHHEPKAERAVPAAYAAAGGTGGFHEPAMRAINGFIHVSHLGNAPRRYYVARDPDFIARQLRQAIAAGHQTYTYWDKPGFADARKMVIPCALVSNVRVEHLEADPGAIFDDPEMYVAV